MTYVTINEFITNNSSTWPSRRTLYRIIEKSKQGKSVFLTAFIRVDNKFLIDPIEFQICLNRNRLLKNEVENAIS